MKLNLGLNLAVAALALLAAGACLANSNDTDNDGVVTASPQPAAAPNPKSDEKPVLPAVQFFGKASAGYEAAKESRDVCAKLFCYCGCDMTDGHTSLLDCFTSDHGADCEVCQDEAIMALQMKQEGKSLAQIQRAVDEKYVKEYPFDKPSKALLAYRKSRLWQPASAEQGADSKKLMLRPSSTPPKPIPGKKVGSCCGNKKAGV